MSNTNCPLRKNSAINQTVVVVVVVVVLSPNQIQRINNGRFIGEKVIIVENSRLNRSEKKR